MRFSSSILAIALASVASAIPQTPAQTTAAANAIVSYFEALQTDPAFLSAVSVINTDSAGAASLSNFVSSLNSVIENHETPAANFLSAIPTEVQSFFGSVYTAEKSIASANGFTPVPTGTATSKNAAPTAKTVGAAAAGLAGFMGVVLAL